MSRHHLVCGAVVAALLVVGCADDTDDTSGTASVGSSTTVTVPAGDQDRDRDRDQDRIREVVADVLDACGNQDRDRLRDHLRTELRERLDGVESRYGPGTTFELVDATVTVDGDRATVMAQVRIRERSQEETTATYEWRLEYSGEWQLSELPPCLVDGVSPTTLGDRDQDQDRDQDREERDDTDTDAAPTVGHTA